MDLEPIPSYIKKKPYPLEYSISTTLQLLPLDKLYWENFERLCWRLASKETNIENCYRYGIQGQKQKGIDFLGYSKSGELFVYQCKKVEKYTPSKIKETITKFLDSHWNPMPKKFVLCCACNLSDTKYQDEILIQRRRFPEDTEFEQWDQEIISNKLKDFSKIVLDFFGETIHDAFIRKPSQKKKERDETELSLKISKPNFFKTMYNNKILANCFLDVILFNKSALPNTITSCEFHIERVVNSETSLVHPITIKSNFSSNIFPLTDRIIQDALQEKDDISPCIIDAYGYKKFRVWLVFQDFEIDSSMLFIQISDMYKNEMITKIDVSNHIGKK